MTAMLALALLAAVPPGDALGKGIAEARPVYRQLHAAPELSGQEVKTAALLAARLKALGYAVTAKLGGAGFIAVLANGAGPTVLLRTDLDALPVQEATGASYASRVPGVMHACGHDLHMASWLGAAVALAEQRAGWRGTVVFLAQPAEEVGTGASAMLRDGVLSKVPRPVAALALHTHAGLPAGTVGLISGPALANVDNVDVTFFGASGHGAYPHQTVDPIVIAARFVTAVQTLVSRERSPFEPAVVTVGSIHGGTKHNIVPGEVRLQLTARSYTDATRQALREGLTRLAKAEAEGGRSPKPPAITIENGANATVNDAALVERLRPVLTSRLAAGAVRAVERSMAGEDFGAYGVAGGFPSVLLWVGAVSPATYAATKGDGLPSLHAAQFLPDEAAIDVGVEVLTASALALLE
ncbi:MAG: amidohydrolase [Myxococcaceae bacterium]|jgi:amidohydrolase|nr:amidohydrolase [Myxococcaceae bacterium]